MIARIIPVEPFDLVIFGGTGDLARRKILPALYHCFATGQMPGAARVIGVARAALGLEGYRRFAEAAICEFVPEARRDGATLAAFLGRLDYVPLDAGDTGETGGAGAEGWAALAGALVPGRTAVFYFSVGPGLFRHLAAGLAAHGLAGPEARIVVEKPFGHDLQSARALNATLACHFAEHQIYRIDHYLGKETVQNLMAVRFANALFEPLWNARHIDHVQITVAETVGVAGRGAYYDGAGAMRDMVQNHMMQLLCLIAMEPPAAFEPDAVRDEKLKVIRALRPLGAGDLVRGQYRAGPGVAGYLHEAGVAESRTESYVALKAQIANWRWAGTPFYLRTGKRLAARCSEIAVAFKPLPHLIFEAAEPLQANMLVIRLQPNEGINLKVTIKEPGPGGMRLTQVPLDMSFAQVLGPAGQDIPDAYERLIMDVIRGNQTLFMRDDEVEAAWAWADPAIAAWEAERAAPMAYAPGSSGPEAALALMQRDGRDWREVRP